MAVVYLQSRLAMLKIAECVLMVIAFIIGFYRISGSGFGVGGGLAIALLVLFIINVIFIAMNLAGASYPILEFTHAIIAAIVVFIVAGIWTGWLTHNYYIGELFSVICAWICGVLFVLDACSLHTARKGGLTLVRTV